MTQLKSVEEVVHQMLEEEIHRIFGPKALSSPTPLEKNSDNEENSYVLILKLKENQDQLNNSTDISISTLTPQSEKSSPTPHLLHQMGDIIRKQEILEKQKEEQENAIEERLEELRILDMYTHITNDELTLEQFRTPKIKDDVALEKRVLELVKHYIQSYEITKLNMKTYFEFLEYLSRELKSCKTIEEKIVNMFIIFEKNINIAKDRNLKTPNESDTDFIKRFGSMIQDYIENYESWAQSYQDFGTLEKIANKMEKKKDLKKQIK